MRITQLRIMLRQPVFAVQRATRCILCARTGFQARPLSVRKPLHICSGQSRLVVRATQLTDALTNQRRAAAANGAATLQGQRANGSQTVQATRKLTFQEAITALEQYWAVQSGVNCAILLPHNTEVGAPPQSTRQLYCPCLHVTVLAQMSCTCFYSSHNAGWSWHNESSHLPEGQWTRTMECLLS